MERTKKLPALAALGALALLVAAILSAGTAGGATFAGAELEFAGDSGEYAAGQIAVPVECVGGPTGFCSGTLSISWRGKRSVSSFSVQGGSSDTITVPLPAGSHGRPTKIAAVATTTQPLGTAVTRKAILRLE
jgi:hypothetical protein